jgi:hypothetical protein
MSKDTPTKEYKLIEEVAKQIALSDSISEGYSYVSEETWDEVKRNGGISYTDFDLDKPPMERKHIQVRTTQREHFSEYFDLAEEIVALVRAEQREEDARIAENYHEEKPSSITYGAMVKGIAHDVAQAIRGTENV